MNFTGLGATVSIKDEGATKFASSFSSSLEHMVGSLGGMVGGAAKAGAALGSMLAGGLKNLTRATESIASFVNSPMTLTTSFEAMGQAHGVATRKILGQNGILGKDLDKLNGQAAGLAMGMKVSDQTAASAVSSMKRFGKELKAVGIDSAKTGVMLEDGMGIGTVDLGNQLHNLATEFKFTDKQLDETTKMLSGAGQMMGDIPGEFKAFPEYLELIRSYSTLAARGVKAIGGVDVIKSLTNSQASLFQLTGDMNLAKKASFGLERTLSQSLDGFQNMFAGTEEDLHPFFEQFSIISGDMEGAFKVAGQGSDKFILKMAEAALKLKNSGGNMADFYTQFQARMTTAMGGDSEAAKGLTDALRNVSEEQLKTMKTLKVGGDSLGKTAKDVWRSSMTLQESYDMMVGAGMAKFRSHGMPAARKFVEDTKKAFGELNDEVDKEIKKGGLLGDLYQKASEISILGAKGLLPQNWRGYAAVAGTMYDTFSPTIEAVGKLGVAASSLVNPLTLAGAAVGGFFALVMKHQGEGKNMEESIVMAFQDVKNYLGGWWQDILNWAATVDWTSVFKTIAEGLQGAIKGLTDIFSSIGQDTSANLTSTVEEIGPKQATFSGVAAKMKDSFKEAFGKIPWEELLGKLWDSFKAMKARLATQFNEFLKETFGSTTDEQWQSLGASMAHGVALMLEGLVSALKNSAENAAQMRAVVITIGFGLAKAVPSIVDGFKQGMVGGSTMGSIIWGLFSPGGMVGEITEWAVTLGMNIGKSIRDFFKEHSILSFILGPAASLTDMIADSVKSKPGDAPKGEMKGEGRVVSMGAFGKVSAEAQASISDTNKAMMISSDQVQSHIDKTSETVRSFGKTFTETHLVSFKDATKMTEVFTKAQDTTYKDMTKSIERIFAEMWVHVLDMTQLASDAMGRTIGKTLSDLHKLKDALAQTESIQKRLESKEVGPDGKLIKREAEKPEEFMLRTINHPEWFIEYAGQFDRGIDRLVDAMGKTAAAAPGVTPGNSSGQQSGAFRTTYNIPGAVSPNAGTQAGK